MSPRRNLDIKKSTYNEDFIACGDLHAEKNSPHYRKDKYWETWQRKMLWIVGLANERGARLLIAGDLFNTSRVPPDVTNVVLAIFNEAHFTPYVVAGQHDLKYHTGMEKTPLFTLALAGAVRIIQGQHNEFTGAGFEEEIPAIENRFLITHTCITESDPPFYLEDAIAATKFMRQHPGYKIIISGDYHVPFMKKLGDRILINTGTIIRNKKDMRKYVPYVWHISIDDGDTTVKKIEVPHEPYDEVFDLEAIEYEEKHGITIDTDKLKELIDSGVESNDIETIVWTIYKELESTGVKVNKKLTEEVLEQCL